MSAKPAKKTPKPDFKKYDALGAQILAHEIVLTSVLAALAKTQPAAARSVVQGIQDMIQHIDEEKYPGVRRKSEEYAAMIETVLTELQ